MNRIIFFIGPSSSGKDTFFKRCLDKYELKPITLLTTRPIRNGEVNGREYYFINNEQMDLLEKRNQLVERRNYNTEYGIWSYATGVEQIHLNKFSHLTPNTWVGYKNFLDRYDKKYLVPIYFEVDEGVRLQRALDRERQPNNGKYAEMCRRFLADQSDFTKELLDYYHPYIIDNNGTIEDTEEQIEDILVRKLEISKKIN